ncbi:thiamine pyrophosphate-dependent acetolactate synthase large subunit-like protein [Sediminitomix flava]|uniref:Thiamine pyrophosphate-dependent acetolactate synthase large subunit-like protein n=2 Tax=Sediminitomix flava TaxID=379075 RepID=A0A315Z6B9_SEDFL|nr:thiamine pyrophosphate-dependent acetolactate synthase large subunit-like protein [Sediminitomix flava]
MKMKKKLYWHKVLDNKDTLKEGRVMTVVAGHKDICLSHFKGKFTALDNKCPHQGGPLGEGSIENGLLRCPWHGWDFCPHGGSSGDYNDGLKTYDVKIENDAIYIGLEEEAPHETTVTDIMVETMVNWGVTSVFGMVGHSNLGLADAIRIQEEKGHLKFIGIRHEGAASFAASAYGKLTGKPAACFAIAGPGSTNLFTGLWDAKVDRSPILALTGQVATQVVGTGNFQEVDLVRAFQTVAEFNQRVEHQSKHTELMALAIKHAILKRDVSHLTFPDQVQVLPAQNEKAQTPEGRIAKLSIAPPEDQLDTAINKIAQAEKPIIIVGHGARFNMKEIIELAEKLNCPVMTTFKGKGQISDSHKLACGVLGRSGTPIASYFMNEADLLIVIGASFSNHTGITQKKPIIQVDFDPLALSKFHKVDVAVFGEISRTIGLIHKTDVEIKANKVNQIESIAKRWKIWRAEKKKRLTEATGHGISSIAVFDTLTRLAPENAIMCVDVGNNAYSFGRYFESKNHNFLMSGYLGSIGFALPAAIGAWAAVGDKRPIIAVAGDGGICQYLAEFTTLVKYNMNIKVIVLNNNELGKITKEQRAGGWDKWATDLVNPSFAKYAQSCGGLGLKVDSEEKLESTIRTLVLHEGPALLEITTDVKLI